MSEAIKFNSSGRSAVLYISGERASPLVVLNTFAGEGADVEEQLKKLSVPEHHLLVMCGLSWEADMSPWECPPLSKNDPPFTGGADLYLKQLTSEILPHAKSLIGAKPAFTAIAGYSLAGLFALYALCRCGEFDRAASMSGSLWYPEFRQFVIDNKPLRPVERLYISLGDKEDRTRQPLLRTVRENTEAIAEHYRSLGINVTYELNEGNHFREPELRTAKGIKAILMQNNHS